MKKPSFSFADPKISCWLKDAIKTAYERDPIEALHDARWLLEMLGERYAQVVNRGLAHSNHLNERSGFPAAQ
jgi:hypothetical protein